MIVQRMLLAPPLLVPTTLDHGIPLLAHPTPHGRSLGLMSLPCRVLLEIIDLLPLRQVPRLTASCRALRHLGKSKLSTSMHQAALIRATESSKASLDQLNAEIARLQTELSASTSAVSRNTVQEICRLTTPVQLVRDVVAERIATSDHARGTRALTRRMLAVRMCAAADPCGITEHCQLSSRLTALAQRC
jgi:hypothetical protein